jgi:uncharacterized integral membrane protein (TIGR00698 family)
MRKFFVPVVPVVPGLLLVSVVTAAAFALGAGSSHLGLPFPLSPLILAVVVGTVVTNLLPKDPGWTPGVRFVSRRILRLAIVLMGFRLSLTQILAVGPKAFVVVLLGSGLTFGFTLALGKRLKLPRNRVLLLASGTSVCGAAAIAAVDGCLGAQEEDVGFALAAVTLFGTLSLLVYPALMAVFHWSSGFYALWVGASIHEVAQVAAAAAILPATDQALASTVKLLRVLFILPITLGLAFLPNLPGRPTRAPGGRKVTVPWFALAFFAVSIVFSFPILSAPVTSFILDGDNILLTAAMAALGLGIHLSRFKTMELRTIWLGLLPTLFLSLTTGLLAWFFS